MKILQDIYYFQQDIESLHVFPAKLERGGLKKTGYRRGKLQALKSVPNDLVLVFKQVQVALMSKAVIRSFGFHKRERTIRLLNYE